MDLKGALCNVVWLLLCVVSVKYIGISARG
jgi:K+ transporter